VKVKLHHFAYNISPDSLELIAELLENFGCNIVYREKNARWCMIQQSTVPIDIQLIETKDKIIPISRKTNTHIAFLSDSPKEDIEEIELWCMEKNVRFRHGKWSDKEFWFDLPEIFINFVIEIMHTSIVE